MTRPVMPPPTWLWKAAADIRAGRASAELDRLAAAIADYRANAAGGRTIEEALGLDTPATWRPWHAVASEERRAELVEQLAAGLAECSQREIARRLLAECRHFERVLRRYLDGDAEPRTWREEWLLELYRMAAEGGPKWPLGERQLRDLIRDVLGSRLADSGAETAQPEGLACA